MRTVYPQPGFVESDLQDLLDTRQFIYAECFTITPIVGSPLRYTNAQKDVTVVPVGGGPARVTYKAADLLITGLRYKTGIGIEVDEQNVTLAYDGSNETAYQAALSWPQALLQGRLDGATIQRDRFFAARWGSPWVAGTPMFKGLVSNMTKVGRQSAELSVKSNLVLLNIQMPKDLWQPQCKNRWGDQAGCVLDRTAFQVNTTVGGPSPTRTWLPWAGATSSFEMGTARIASTDAVTRIRTILKVEPGVGVHLIYPLDFDPVIGTDVAYQPNCRRLFENCGDYHASPEEVFIGFPHVPVAETAA